MKEISVDDPALKPWIGKDLIIHAKWKENKECLYIITQNRITNKFSLLRCFYLVNNIEISVDINNYPAEDFLRQILEWYF